MRFLICVRVPLFAVTLKFVAGCGFGVPLQRLESVFDAWGGFIFFKTASLYFKQLVSFLILHIPVAPPYTLLASAPYKMRGVLFDLWVGRF